MGRQGETASAEVKGKRSESCRHLASLSKDSESLSVMAQECAFLPVLGMVPESFPVAYFLTLAAEPTKSESEIQGQGAYVRDARLSFPALKLWVPPPLQQDGIFFLANFFTVLQ